MGVPDFFRYLRDRYGVREDRDAKTAFQHDIPALVSSLALDMNSLFHQAAGIVYGYDSNALTEYKMRKIQQRLKNRDPEKVKQELFKAILTEVKNIVMATNPQDTLVIAVDGMAPVAKMQQQRQRRYKTAKEKKSGSFFDSNAFSPGTQLMVELDEYLKENLRVHDPYSRNPVGEGIWLPPKIIYSGHLVPGEGEHKIMDFYRNGDVEGPIAKNGGCHIIHGLDADLIMLSMLLPQEKVFMMREDIRNIPGVPRVNILNIDSLREKIQIDLGTPTAIDDFLVLMYFIGNDFIPRIKAFSGGLDYALDKMFETYRRVGKSLSYDDGKRLDLKGLFYFLYYFHQIEPDLVEKLGRVRFGEEFPSLVTENSMKKGKPDYTLFRNNWYHYALAPPPTSQDLLKTFNIPEKVYKPRPKDIQEMCVQYIAGMAWTSLYYRVGMKGVNTNWSYPYFYAPMLIDLVPVIKLLVKNTLRLPPVEMSFKVLKYNVVHQMLCILPKKSMSLLPEAAQVFYLDESPIIDQFPEDFLLDRDGKMKSYQAHALVPHADIERILIATRLLELDRSTVKKLSEEKSKIWVQKRRTQDEAIYLQRPLIRKDFGLGLFAPRENIVSSNIMLDIPLSKRLESADLDYASYPTNVSPYYVFASKKGVPKKIPRAKILKNIGSDYSELPILISV